MIGVGGRAGRARLLGVVLAAAVVLLAACGSGGGHASASPGKANDTVTWAEPASNVPDWIWPYMPADKESNLNLSLQMMLFRPLYFFGAQGTPTVSNPQSLAEQPSYSADGKTLTIQLKPYKWSNGESVTASDVIFWINLMKAEKSNWFDYTPGLFPDNVTSATAEGSSTVVLTTTEAYNPKWFLYNQLSQITPMPAAWDKTSATQQGDCDTDESDCAAVYSYLKSQASDLPGYATSPVWSVVDGPWKLKSFSSDGHVTLVPNPSYSGPIKPRLKSFTMVPFTTQTAEFNVLRSGKTIDVGYLPPEDLNQPKPANTPPTDPGPNPLSGYTLAPWFLYGFSFFTVNFNNPTVGPIFRQLYFRQALQSLVDQPAIIRSAGKNYAVQTTGPIPHYPPSPELSSVEKNNPYPFSVAKAKQLLTENGWNVKAGGVTTCVKPGTGPGECGAGIAQGQGLQFQMAYLSGLQTAQIGMESLKSNASRAGMQITLKGESFDTVIGSSAACSGPTCTWQMAYWGNGWSYGPDYYPTGESLFSTGAGSNSGNYSDPQVDQLINATLTSSDPSVLIDYENAVAKNLPVIWEPTFTAALTEVGDGLHGVTPQNPFNWLTPENWHY